MPDRASQALVALRRILRATDLNARLLARESGLTPSQLVVLQIVGAEGKVLPGKVAREMHLTQATVTALVDKLVNAGLVSRRRDTEDRRRIWIEPTAAGQDRIAQSPDLLQDRFANSFDSLPDWQQSMLIAALEQVSSMLDAESIDAAPLLDVGEIAR